MRFLYVLITLGIICQCVVADDFAEIAKEIEDFFHDPEVTDFRVSPGGRCLSYVEYLEKSRRSLMTVDLSTSISRGMAAGPGQDIYVQAWVGPDTIVGAKLGLEGNRFLGAFSAKVLFESVENLDDGLKRIPRVEHAMPQDSMYCAVIDRKENTRFPDVRIMNVKTGEFTSRVKNPGRAIRFFYDSLGRPRIAKALGKSEGQVVWYYRSGEENSEWELFETPRRIEDWRFFDDSSIAYAEVHDEVRLFVQPFDLEKGEFVGKPIASPDCDVTVDGFQHSPDDQSLYGITIDDPIPRNIWMDTGLLDLEKLIMKIKGECLVRFLGVNNSSNEIFFSLTSDVEPVAFYAIGNSGMREIAKANSRLGEYTLAHVKPISFENRDGIEIRGYLTMPNGRSENAPMLVMPHGGPHSNDNWDFNARTQFYVHKGFAVLNINYRGSSGRGRAFWLQDGFASILERSVNDVIDATKWAIEEGFADPDRIGITGGSFGGYIAVESVAREPDLFQCAVGFAGVYDWPRQLAASRRDDSRGWDWFLSDEFGDLRESKSIYESLSPINHIDLINVPILLVHGRDDRRVENIQSKLLHRALIKAGKKSDLSIDLWGRHGFIDEKRRIDYYTREYEFLENWILRN